MSKSWLLTAAVAFAALVGSAGSAHATVSVTLPATGTAMIGVVKDAAGVPSVAVITQDVNNGCHQTNIFTNYGGLLDFVQVHGSSGADLIGFAGGNGGTQPVAFCNFVVYPLVNWGGYAVDIFGGSGADWLVGGANDTYVYGEAGADLCVTSTYPNPIAAGGDDNDKINAGGNGSASIYGENGDDWVEANGFQNSYRVKVMDGGPGYDSFCGWATTTFTGVEVLLGGCS